MAQRATRIAALAAIALIVSASLASSCGPRRGRRNRGPSATAPAQGRAVVEILLDGPLPEANIVPLGARDVATMRHLRSLVARMRADDDVAAVLVRLRPIGLGWSSMHDVVDLLRSLRAAGRKVHCHLEGAGNAEYALAAQACDRISMPPAADLELVGLAMEIHFFRRLLDDVGIRADLMEVGRYKGAADSFTETELPLDLRTSLDAIVGDLYDGLVEAVASGRHLPADAVRRAIESGPLPAAAALEARLIDAVEDVDSARDEARREAPAARLVRDYGRREQKVGELGDIMGLLRSTPEVGQPEAGTKRVAVVILSGPVVMSAGGPSLTGGDSIAVEPVERLLDELGTDRDVEAVVLRISSPGGSALASDLIWTAVRRLRETKPVVASIGDMAASGGYYIASAANRIVAPDAALTGSIGVVGGKIVLGPLMDRIGIKSAVLSRGRNAALDSVSRPFDDRERALVRNMLERTYAQFLDRVSTGRAMPVERVRAAAEGRLWSGRRAREVGLVDEPGGYDRAIAVARDLGRLPGDAPVVIYPRARGLIETLTELIGGSPFSFVPVGLRERVFAGGGLAPLVDGERAACAMAFGVTIR